MNTTKKTTAIVRWRYNNNELVVEFSGYREDAMKKRWEEIRDYDYNALYQKNKKQINDLYSRAYLLIKTANDSKRFWRPWHTKKEKIMLLDAENLKLQAAQLENENKKIETWKGINASFLIYSDLIHFLRVKKGFVHKNNFQAEDCRIETWILEE